MSLFNQRIPMNLPIANGITVHPILEAFVYPPNLQTDQNDPEKMCLLFRFDRDAYNNQQDKDVCESFLNKNSVCLNPSGESSRLYSIPREKVRQYVKREADQEVEE